MIKQFFLNFFEIFLYKFQKLKKTLKLFISPNVKLIFKSHFKLTFGYFYALNRLSSCSLEIFCSYLARIFLSQTFKMPLHTDGYFSEFDEKQKKQFEELKKKTEKVCKEVWGIREKEVKNEKPAPKVTQVTHERPKEVTQNFKGPQSSTAAIPAASSSAVIPKRTLDSRDLNRTRTVTPSYTQAPQMPQKRYEAPSSKPQPYWQQQQPTSSFQARQSTTYYQPATSTPYQGHIAPQIVYVVPAPPQPTYNYYPSQPYSSNYQAPSSSANFAPPENRRRLSESNEPKSSNKWTNRFFKPE